MTLAHMELLQAQARDPLLDRLDRLYYVADRPEQYAVRPQVVQEAIELTLAGVDVRLEDVQDPYALPPVAQQMVDEHIAQLESAPDGDRRFVQSPAMAVWSTLRMRAHALQPLYTPWAETLGGPITPGAYDRPLFRSAVDDGGVTSIRMLSAADIVMREYGGKGREAKGADIVAKHRAFVSQQIDPVSRLFYEGSKDGASIRTRAYTAIGMGIDHFARPDGTIERRGMRCASFACGAAGPVSLLVRDMQKRGAEFEKVYMLDQDPLALAGAYQTLEDAGVSDDIIDAQLTDLVRGDFEKTIEPGSLDIADLLGLIEYLPDELAIALLAKVRTRMKPGGVVLWGNMVKDRPQQKMFKEVVKWPPLKQRTIKESLGLAIKAGYDIKNTTAAVSAREGVYANFAMRIPEVSQGAVSRAGALAIAS